MNNTTKAYTDLKDSLTSYKEAADGGSRVFSAQITYSYNGIQLKENLEVCLFLIGANAGNIIIQAGETITAKTVHLEFKPRFQEYTFTEDGTFKIKGTNSLIIGDYEVSIVPFTITP